MDYIKELGATAIWCTPVQENNHTKYTYHGYAISDLYKLDPRFGSNDEYFVFKDFPAYCKAHEVIEQKYLDTAGWQRSSLINIAHSGIFSSDRTIMEYAKEIWDIHPIELPSI